MKRIILLAASLYLLLAPLSYHPDNKVVLKWVSSDYWKVWNIYDHTLQTYGEGGVFNYPPVNFLFAKLQWPVSQFIGGEGFYEWLHADNESAVFDAQLYRYTFATKFSLLLISLLTGWLIYKLALIIASEKSRAQLAAMLWLFNPIVIYSVVFMGQNDVLAICLFILGWMWLIKSHLAIAVLAFGMAISTKSYPVIWLVFLLLGIKALSLTKKILVLLASLMVYQLTTIPFRLSEAFKTYVLNSGINERFFVPQINLGQDEVLYIIPLLLFILLIFTLYLRSINKINHIGIIWILFVANFLLLGFSHFHPQWFTWLVPFWAIWISSLPTKMIFKALTYSVTILGLWLMIIVLYIDKYLTWGIISPLNPQLINMPLIYDYLINNDFNVSKIVNSTHTAIAGVALFLFIATFGKFWEWSHINTTSYKINLPSRMFLGRYGWVTMPIILIFSSIFVAQAIPAPISVLPSTNPSYQTTQPNQISRTFTSAHNRLNRIDLYVKNPDFESSDEYMFKVYKDNGQIHYHLPFSAANAGDPSLIRFDFPPLNNSKDTEITITLEQIFAGEKQLLFGLNSKKELLVREYYKPSISISTIVNNSLSQFSLYLSQLYIIFLALHLLLIFLIIPGKNSKY
jgi:hypothetical protein